MNDDPKDWPIISQYSRMRAIEDGVLVDLSITAKRFGFKYPVAITQGAYESILGTYEKKESTEAAHKVTAGLVLIALKNAIAGVGSTDRIEFGVQGIDLWALCGPGDTAAPVITVMLEGED